jgi:hypothetical protein
LPLVDYDISYGGPILKRIALDDTGVPVRRWVMDSRCKSAVPVGWNHPTDKNARRE